MPDDGIPYKPRILFKKVHAAREALRERAEELISEYIDIAKQAKASGDYESAYKALQWLIDHIPAEEDGTRVVDRSQDKIAITDGSRSNGPQINVGIMVGGVGGKKKELPMITAQVIDVKPDK